VLCSRNIVASSFWLILDAGGREDMTMHECLEIMKQD
jgi:hypothetical protein